MVDSDEAVRETLADMVESTGRHILMARDGIEGLELLGEVRRPCVVLLGLEMSPMSGQEFLQKLGERTDAGDFRVAAMSRTTPLPQSARNSPGVVALLRKPFGIDELKPILDEHC
ncbi:MAG: response regulator [Archangium sp.]